MGFEYKIIDLDHTTLNNATKQSYTTTLEHFDYRFEQDLSEREFKTETLLWTPAQSVMEEEIVTIGGADYSGYDSVYLIKDTGNWGTYDRNEGQYIHAFHLNNQDRNRVFNWGSDITISLRRTLVEGNQYDVYFLVNGEVVYEGSRPVVGGYNENGISTGFNIAFAKPIGLSTHHETTISVENFKVSAEDSNNGTVYNKRIFKVSEDLEYYWKNIFSGEEHYYYKINGSKTFKIHVNDIYSPLKVFVRFIKESDGSMGVVYLTNWWKEAEYSVLIFELSEDRIFITTDTGETLYDRTPANNYKYYENEGDVYHSISIGTASGDFDGLEHGYVLNSN